LAFARLAPAASRARLWTAAAAVLIVLEGFALKMQAAPIPPRVDFAGLDRAATVLELPMTDDFSDTAAMLRATYSGHALVNGFSGYLPPHYLMLQEGLRQRDPSVLDALQSSASILVFVHAAGDADGKYRAFMDRLPDVQQLTTTAAGALYRLPSRL